MEGDQLPMASRHARKHMTSAESMWHIIKLWVTKLQMYTMMRMVQKGMGLAPFRMQ